MKALIFYLLSFLLSAQAEIVIPEFTPNVVDLTQTLSAADMTEVNLVIGKVRQESGIMAAIFIVPSLDGETIESLSERTFRQWRLGKEGVNNGLLFVISIADRKSKIETGYGLEGDLPDAIVRRVLDGPFRVHAKAGNFKLGFIEALEMLSAIRRKQLDPQEIKVEGGHDKSSDDFEFKRGLVGWLMYMSLVIGIPAVWNRSRRNRFDMLKKNLNPQLRIQLEREWEEISADKKGGFPFKIFFAINPGLFIFMGFAFMGSSKMAIPIGILIYALVVSITYVIFKNRYSWLLSPDAFGRYIVEKASKNALYEKSMIDRGLMERSNDGSARYTDKYYAEERSSSSSSSGSSSSNSSSSGGSSGGGGASSDW